MVRYKKYASFKSKTNASNKVASLRRSGWRASVKKTTTGYDALVGGQRKRKK